MGVKKPDCPSVEVIDIEKEKHYMWKSVIKENNWKGKK